MYDIKSLSAESNSTALIIPQTKFEAIISKDVEEDRFQAKALVSRQILDFGRHSFLPVAPMVTILVFPKSQCKELTKNVYVYPLLTYSFSQLLGQGTFYFFRSGQSQRISLLIREI